MSTLEMSARYHQQELLREAANARLIHEAHGENGQHRAHHHQVIAAVMAVLMAVAFIALI